MHPFRLGLFFLIAALPLMAADIDVKSHGAVGDGVALDTAAINRAIEAAAAGGGGTVRFPAGTYLSFSIRLRSHVSLALDHGATIIAAEPAADGSTGYDVPEPNPAAEPYADFGHVHWHNSLIWGENLDDISIVGSGTIYGRGLSKVTGRRDLLPAERAQGLKEPPPAFGAYAPGSIKPGPFNYPNPRDSLPPGVGNKAIALKNCRNVTLRDFTIYHGGHFGLLATGTDNLTVDHVTIDTNRDGMDIDACRNVRISDCTVNSPYDDGICLKSSFALGVVRACENVTITGCLVSGYDEGTIIDGSRRRDVDHGARQTTAGIKLGTESNGGFKAIAVTNCVFDYSRGFAIELVDGGALEDLSASNLTMRDIVNSPFFIRLGSRNRGPNNPPTGTLRRIAISNVVASDLSANQCILISGVPDHAIENVVLSNLVMSFRGGGTSAQAAAVVKEMETGYPDPRGFGVLPAYAMFCRHVRGLTLHHVELQFAKAEARPALIFDDVHEASLDHVKAQKSATATLRLKGVSEISLERSAGLPDFQSSELIPQKEL